MFGGRTTRDRVEQLSGCRQPGRDVPEPLDEVVAPAVEDLRVVAVRLFARQGCSTVVQSSIGGPFDDG